MKDNKKHIVCFSGGKDSTTMLLKMVEANMKIDKIIFADTTLEYPEMYDYIDTIEKYIDREIIKTTPKKSFDEWCYGKFIRGNREGEVRGLPAVLCPCYWMRESKVNPMQSYTKGNHVYFGITCNEQHRAKEKKGMFAHYPLIEWGMTENGCNHFLRNLGLLNPLYHHMKRTGCWLCPKQSIISLRFLYNNHLDLWEKLKVYEQNSPCGFKIDKTLDEFEIQFKRENNRIRFF